MIKLLFAISQLYKGGAETSLVNLLNYLDYDQYEVELLVLNQIEVEGVVSLLPQVNKKVKICDAYAEFKKINYMDRIKAKFIYTTEQKSAYYFTALDFVRGKKYDYAFWIGEWVIPSFVAYHVNAKQKAAWLHTDISMAKYFDAEAYFSFDDCIDKYIFVSKNSLESSLRKYPFIKDKSEIIYNITDSKTIKQKFCEPVTDLVLQEDIPVIVTCANIREEKNHLRQVRVMAELRKKGIYFYWINIGSTANKELVNKISVLCKKEKLEKYFLLLGAKENPYKYMKLANAVTVLSDFESWSMVITEAKLLGVPVIATKTSGALEQIENEKTGLLTEFNDRDIAKQIEFFICNPNIQKEIRKNLQGFDNTNEVLKTFDCFLHKKSVKSKDILYIIDDVNYKSGAHNATIRQIQALQDQGRKISIFSNTIPDCKLRTELNGVSFMSWMSNFKNKIYLRRTLDCLLDKKLPLDIRKKKLWMCYEQRIKKNKKVWEEYVLESITNLCSEYSVVTVMSEASAFRYVVSKSSCKNKIQWIHTDYCSWREFNEWTKEITKNDEQIYLKYNKVVVLSEKIKEDITILYPSLKEKIRVSKNLMPVNEIIEKSESKKVLCPSVHFITVGRLSKEKAYDRLIIILSELKKKGYQFLWEIIGDGPEKDDLKRIIKKLNLDEEVILLGQRDNPYYYIKRAQVFALLSVYEGMPNTIYESLILGTPVLATDVGGISEQIENGINGWLVKNDKDEIAKKICYLIEHQEEIEKAKRNAEKYEYNNESIKDKLLEIYS
ncbi:MAG: glycosyltransferase [Lachnospiraceae bacterium]|nr:glycosyltransferase [Lachnospiraceae bacterium]